MKTLLIVSGRSGSGKSSALNILEDFGYFCIDNLPVELLPQLVEHFAQQPHVDRIGLGIDARALSGESTHFDDVLNSIDRTAFRVDVLFLDARDDVILARYNATRRRHPLTFGDPPVPLSEAVRAERRILEPLASRASVFLDTSDINTHDLQRLLSIRLADSNRLHVLFESFGFKNGVPLDADFVFDVRSLPNPHWVPHLRPLTGKDDEIAQFFRGNELVEMMFDDVYRFLSSWLPRLAAEHRHYLTIAIGCTGGQHRSVYMVERLAARMAENNLVIQTLHRELAKSHD